MGRSCRLLAYLVSTVLVASGLAQEPASDPAKVEFDPAHAEKMQEGLALFKRSVRTILIDHCVDCHGDSEVESGFDLATRKGLFCAAVRTARQR